MKMCSFAQNRTVEEMTKKSFSSLHLTLHLTFISSIYLFTSLATAELFFPSLHLTLHLFISLFISPLWITSSSHSSFISLLMSSIYPFNSLIISLATAECFFHLFISPFISPFISLVISLTYLFIDHSLSHSSFISLIITLLIKTESLMKDEMKSVMKSEMKRWKKTFGSNIHQAKSGVISNSLY